MKKVDAGGTTYTPGEHNEVKGCVVTKYYYLGDQRVAMRAGSSVYWLHSDHLGSASLTTDINGGIHAQQRYFPYGEVRWQSGSLPTDRQYTDQRREASLGIYDYKARFYSPRLGRFLSADTIVPGVGSMYLNRYMYTVGNPVLYNDPDGRCGPLCVIGLAVTLLVVATIPSGVHSYERGICPQHQCEPLDRYNTTIGYMHTEMTGNAQGEITSGIQQLHGALKKGAWGVMVAPHSLWDHKPKLEKLLGLRQEQHDFYFPIEGNQEHEYFYDIWSNIHYGYVGTAAGFDANTLQSGAAVPGLAGTNDAYDVLSIQIGIDLWNQYGLKLTVEQLRDAILAHTDEYLAIWRDVYNYDERYRPPVISSTDGNGR